MIKFDNWMIRLEKETPLRQFDNGVSTLIVTGSLPEGWEWVMLVRNGKNMDLLPLEPMDGGFGIVLTAERLAVSGFYHLQLRGKKETAVRHTNMVTLYVEASLSGDVQWPDVPTVFSELEGRITEKAEQAQAYAVHSPMVGENGNWWTWEGAGYVDTGNPSQGKNGAPGAAGEPGYTPEKGVDYYTEADKLELVDAVLAALPAAEGVAY